MRKNTTKIGVKTPRFQNGLTLIELAVVLAILVALSTLMMPYIGGYINRAEVSTSNYNANAVLNALQQYYALYRSYPNNLDLLSTGNGSGAEAIPVYLDDTAQVGRPAWVPNDTAYVVSTSTNFGTMMDNGSMAASLAKVGINRYYQLKTGSVTQDAETSDWVLKDENGVKFDATYGSQAANPVTLVTQANATPTSIMFVSDNCGGFWIDGHRECIANILGYKNCKIDKAGTCPPIPNPDQPDAPIQQGGSHMLILLGVNQNNEMIGRTMTTAPVHFPANKSTNPSLVYSRFLAVFDVDMRGGCWKDQLGCDPAKLVGVVVGPDATTGWQTATTGMSRAFKTSVSDDR